MHQFSTEQWLPFPKDLVFAFFANPANLPPLMPRWQKARIEEVTFCPPPPRPEGSAQFPGVAAGNGTRLAITARGFPMLPLRGTWLAEIQDFRWNQRFCDVQLRGPFAYWRHCHSVHDAENNGTPGTTVRDRVSYALPLDPLAQRTYPAVNLGLLTVFRYRQARAAELLPRFAAQAGSLGSL